MLPRLHHHFVIQAALALLAVCVAGSVAGWSTRVRFMFSRHGLPTWTPLPVFSTARAQRIMVYFNDHPRLAQTLLVWTPKERLALALRTFDKRGPMPASKALTTCLWIAHAEVGLDQIERSFDALSDIRFATQKVLPVISDIVSKNPRTGSRVFGDPIERLTRSYMHLPDISLEVLEPLPLRFVGSGLAGQHFSSRTVIARSLLQRFPTQDPALMFQILQHWRHLWSHSSTHQGTTFQDVLENLSQHPAIDEPAFATAVLTLLERSPIYAVLEALRDFPGHCELITSLALCKAPGTASELALAASVIAA